MELTPVSCATILISNVKSISLAFFNGQFRGTGPWPTCLCELAYCRIGALMNCQTPKVSVCADVCLHIRSANKVLLWPSNYVQYLWRGRGRERPKTSFWGGWKILGVHFIHCSCGRPLFLLSAQWHNSCRSKHFFLLFPNKKLKKKTKLKTCNLKKKKRKKYPRHMQRINGGNHGHVYSILSGTVLGEF